MLEHHIIKDLEKVVLNAISARNYDSALNIISHFVETVFNDSQATAEFFSSPELDSLCHTIGFEVWNSSSEGYSENREFDKECAIYIASILYQAGGHTRIIEDLIKARQNYKRQIIFLTYMTPDNSDFQNVRERFGRHGVSVECAQGNTALEKLQWMQRKILDLYPDQIYLFNHHQDSIAVSSVQGDFLERTIYFHHADHNLALGVHLPHVKHVDPHNIGFHNCRTNLGISDNVYWPLAIEDMGVADRIFLAEGKLKTCSSGTQNKFQGVYAYSYPEVIANVLKMTGGTHIHIGPLSSPDLDFVCQQIESKGIGRDRFIHIPWVETLWMTLISHQVDLYLSSFPLGGGRASIEAMGAGVPLVMHQSYLSRFHGGADLVYPESFSWRRPEELYRFLKEVTPGLLAQQSLYARRHYEKYHSMERLKEAMIQGRGLQPPPLRPFKSDQLQRYLHQKRLISLEVENLCSNREEQLKKLKIDRLQQKCETAQSEVEAGNIDKAEFLHQEILREDPKHYDSLRTLGLIAFQKGKKELAAEYFLKAIAVEPDDPVLLNNAGVVLYQLGQLGEARTFYELALRHKPEYAEAHGNLGVVCRDQGNQTAALEYFKTALRLKPDYFEARKYLDELMPGQGSRINKKIAFIDCEFHKKTRSTFGLIELIKKNFQEVDIYWDDGSLDFQKIADQHYDTVVFFQQIYGARRLKALNTKNIILIPMYDDVREIADSYWKQFSQVKFLNFSKKLHHKLLLLGLNSTYIQYYGPPSNLPGSVRNAGGLSAFFWQRTNHIRWSTIKTLIQDSSFKDFHIHSTMDPPGRSFEKPSSEDIEKYKILISDWFPNQEEYLNLLNFADVFFAPRLYEGIGMSFLEAMAMGKCVVAPNLPTMNEYIRHGETGLLYDPDNPVPLDFSRALEIGENARRSVEEGYRKWKEGKKGLIQFITEP